MSDAETARILGLSEDRLRVVLLALASTAEGQNQIKEILNDLDEPSQATKKATTSARRKRKAAEPTDTEPTGEPGRRDRYRGDARLESRLTEW